MQSASPRPPRQAALRRFLAVFLSLTLLIPAGTVAVRAFSPDEVQHFIDCYRLMLTDPEGHRTECSPYNGPAGQAVTLAPGTFGPPGAPITTTSVTATVTTTVVTTLSTTVDPTINPTIEPTIEPTVDPCEETPQNPNPRCES